MPDEGPTAAIILGSLAVIMFLIGVVQSLWWLWEQSPWAFAILAAVFLALLAIRTFTKIFTVD